MMENGILLSLAAAYLLRLRWRELSSLQEAGAPGADLDAACYCRLAAVVLHGFALKNLSLSAPVRHLRFPRPAGVSGRAAPVGFKLLAFVSAVKRVRPVFGVARLSRRYCPDAAGVPW